MDYHSTEFLNAYKHKLKTIDGLCGIIGPRPRANKVIFAHGMFDIVHPGHIRHLLYAKSQANILIVSITADIHADKGAYRPFVPQDLRALNLAALSVVDYVLIDEEETPIKNLLKIKPDFFVKGYEYRDRSDKTDQEIKAVESYGGEILFSPGDVVYSSSEIITSKPPDISITRLLTLMEAEDVTFQELYNCFEQFNGLKVHVVGDTIVDILTHGVLTGGLNKTPTHSMRITSKNTYLGGAAVVASHLVSAGADVTLSTVLGNDVTGDYVKKGLLERGIKALHITDHTRSTTTKNTFLCNEYRLLKVDTVDNHSISDQILDQLVEQIHDIEADIIIFSDFRHGIFNSRTIPRLCLIATTPKTPRWTVADSQVASRWGNITDFIGFDIIAPNEREARFALGDQDSGIRPLADKLYNKAKCGFLMLKLGERGVLTCRDNLCTPRSFFVVDSFTNKVVDPVGAGDAFLAYATLGTRVLHEVGGTILGSIAAALECEREGNIPISHKDVANRLQTLETFK